MAATVRGPWGPPERASTDGAAAAAAGVGTWRDIQGVGEEKIRGTEAERGGDTLEIGGGAAAAGGVGAGAAAGAAPAAVAAAETGEGDTGEAAGAEMGAETIPRERIGREEALKRGDGGWRPTGSWRRDTSADAGDTKTNSCLLAAAATAAAAVAAAATVHQQHLLLSPFPLPGERRRACSLWC